MNTDMANIANLEEEQRVAFLRVLAGIANADDNLDDDEKEFITNIAIIYGISEQSILNSLFASSDEDIIDAAKKIKERRTKLELIKEMCMIAHVNKKLEEKEMIMLGRVAQAMEVELEKVEEISSWVLDRIIWLEEAKIIFEEA